MAALSPEGRGRGCRLLSLSDPRAFLLPLPLGEGWGEGQPARPPPGVNGDASGAVRAIPPSEGGGLLPKEFLHLGSRSAVDRAQVRYRLAKAGKFQSTDVSSPERTLILSRRLEDNDSLNKKQIVSAHS